MEQKRRFADRYLERVAVTKSILCVGLDLAEDHLPPGYPDGPNGFLAYGKRIIEMAASKVPAVKFQSACYEAYGPLGIGILVELIDFARTRGLLVILDAKRVDTADTMERYGQAVFKVLRADACTFTPYLGPTFLKTSTSDGWRRYLSQGAMVISMILTSNEEGSFLQRNRLVGHELFVYQYMATKVRDWNQQVLAQTDGLGAVGGVVGATASSDEAQSCRDLAGDDIFFLIPGYGAQGGGAEGAIAGLPTSDGRLMGTVNNSRGTTRDSWKDKKTGMPKDPKRDPLEFVSEAIDQANTDLNAALTRKLGRDPYN